MNDGLNTRVIAISDAGHTRLSRGEVGCTKLMNAQLRAWLHQRGDVSDGELISLGQLKRRAAKMKGAE